MCGYDNQSADHCKPEMAMRWAYPDGSGNFCWYCERVWQSQLAHLHDSRAAYQKSLRTDKDVLDSHRAAVMDFIDAKKSGRHRVALKRTGQATY